VLQCTACKANSSLCYGDSALAENQLYSCWDAALAVEQCCCAHAGVEVWVQVQSALGIDAGIPAAAKMVCDGVTPQEPKDVDFTVRLAPALVAACQKRLVAPAQPLYNLCNVQHA
jgi:hypothetical protein